MNIKKIKKNLIAFLLMFGFLTFPAFSFAGLDWGAGVSSNGNVSFGVGSQGSGAGNVWGGGYGGGGGWMLSNPYGLPQGSLLGIASNLLFWLLMIFAIAGVLGFVISGVYYLIAAGDDTMMKKGKAGIGWSITGIAVGLSGFVIMQAVAALLSGTSKSF